MTRPWQGKVQLKINESAGWREG